MNFIKNYFNKRTVAFYVALGVAALSLITAIVYAGVFGASEYMSWGAFVMLLLALPVFAGLSFIRLGKFDLSRIAAGIVAAFNFASLVLVVINIFPFVWDTANQYAMDGTIEGGSLLGGGIAVVVFTVICAIISNVLAWLKMSKQPKTEKEEEEIPEEKTADDGEGELA